MSHFTSNTYTLKRKILAFTNKISKNLSKPERKFTADITYGMLASGSCLLTDVCDQLHEPSKKINVVDRLSRHLEKGTPIPSLSAYLQQIKKWVPAHPVIHIDDTDVVVSSRRDENYLRPVHHWKALPQKMCIKKAIMLQKPAFSLLQIIRSAFFLKYILLTKKIINLPIPLLFKP